MSVQILIGIYASICLSMIAFNCFYTVWFRVRDWRIARLNRKYQTSLQAGALPAGRGRRKLLRRLGRVDELMAFCDALEQMKASVPQEVMREAAAMLGELLPRYARRSDMHQACYARELACFHVMEAAPSEALTAFLLELSQSGSIYRRENALRALYAGGQVAPVTEALHLVDEGDQYFNTRLITEGLLSFSGDREALIAALWPQLERYGSEMRVAVLNFVRFGSGNWGGPMLALMRTTKDMETAIACMRYFGRYPKAEALPLLLHEASCMDKWERSGVAMTALAAYPGDESIQALKRGLSSTNWYVRSNAADSLLKLGADYAQLRDVLEGPDRYARQMLRYRFQQSLRKAQTKADTAGKDGGGKDK